LFEGLTFKVANAHEADRALTLRRELYLDEFGCDGLDERDATAHHLVALNADQIVVAAMRIIDVAHRPFDLEDFVELPALPEGRQPAEVGRFCMTKEYRRIKSSQLVHLGMCKLMFVFAERRGVTDLFTLGLLQLRNVYRLAFFTELDIFCQHPIGDQHVQLMHLDIERVRATHATSRHPVARLIFQSDVISIQPE
jgi:N-acyl-L-homoserine lactone synthetase